MKPTSLNIFVTSAAAAVWAAIFLSPTRVSGAEEVNFFQKFVVNDPCNWAGFYIGVNNGATFNHFDLGRQMTDVNLSDQFYDLIPQSFGQAEGVTTFHIPGHDGTDTETIGGGQIGFNFQFGHFVVGAEGSIIGNGSTTDSKYHEFQRNQLFSDGQPNVPAQGVTAETDFASKRMVETTWNGFIGGKLGFCWNRLLFYGTGGAAFTDAHFESWQQADTSFFENVCKGDFCATPQGPQTVQPNRPSNGFIGEIVSKKKPTQGDVLTGWYGGVGTEYELTNIVSVGLEYKHVDWGDVTEHLVGGNGPIFAGNGRLDLTADQVVFKVNVLVGPIGH